jgi:hypothetical protein
MSFGTGRFAKCTIAVNPLSRHQARDQSGKEASDFVCIMATNFMPLTSGAHPSIKCNGVRDITARRSSSSGHEKGTLCCRHK